MAGIVESAIGMLTSVGPYVIPKLQSSVETVYSCISDYLAKFSVGAIPRGAHRGANAKGDDQIKSALRKEDADMVRLELEKEAHDLHKELDKLLSTENVEKDDRKYADKDACETIKTLCGGLEEYRKECGTAGVKDWPAHMTKVLEELNPGCHLAAAVTTDSEGGSASTPFTKLRKNYVNEYHHKTPGGQLKRMEWAWPLFRKPAVLNTIITRVDVVCSADLRAEFRTFSTDDCGRTWRQHGACKIDVKSWSDAEEKTKENTDQVEWNAMPFRQPLCLFQDSDAWYPASESPTTLEFLKAHLDRDHPRDDPRAFTCYPRNAVLTYLNESIYVTGGLDYTLGRASKMHFRMQMMDGRLHKPVPRDNMLEEVYGHSSCVFGNNIYFCGGFGRKGKRKTVQIYATRLTEKDSTRDSVSGTALTGHDQWVLGNPMLQAKANLGTAVLFNYLYAMDSSSCERMDLFEQKWEPLDYPADIQEKFKSDKKFFTSCCSQNGKLLVLFSSLTETDCAYHTSFDPTTEQWEPLAEVLFTINGVESAAVIFSKLFACEKTAPPFEELLKKDVNFAHFRELIRC
ncbi:hypothetical protein RvY_15322-2 [Ramazzottius varieornatus]|uniref:Uncharacterized protein n=1 Tax=Ramazzottius varieornatus TaxID=947166 RepID=A0A1D1VZ88_RAMVA|nr:hypothetical protein RvY_15322-2 [Ramazzottius varieornatus]